MFTIMVDSDGFKWYYATGRRNGKTITYRWDQTCRERQFWEIVPWVGY